MKKINLITILILIFVTVGISGCTSSGSSVSLNNTFSNGSITFNYPSNWNTFSYTADVVSGGDQLQSLGGVETNDDNVSVTVSKADLTGYSYSIQYMAEATKANIKDNADVTILSNTQTTIDNMTAYEFIFTLRDPTTNEESKHLYVTVGQAGNYIYYLDFKSPSTDFKNNYDLFNSMISTINIE